MDNKLTYYDIKHLNESNKLDTYNVNINGYKFFNFDSNKSSYAYTQNYIDDDKLSNVTIPILVTGFAYLKIALQLIIQFDDTILNTTTIKVSNFSLFDHCLSIMCTLYYFGYVIM